MSLGSMTAARIQMGLLAAAVLAVSLVWLLPVGVLGTSTRVLADSTNQAEAAPLLGIRVSQSDLVGATLVANLTSCLFGSDGLGGDIAIVTCFNTDTLPLSSCATVVTAVNSAAAASGGNQTTYTRNLIASGTDALILGGEVATTLLTADGPAKGVVGLFIFATDTTDATANLERALSFYQAIVDNAEFTGSSLVLGVELAFNNQCLDPAGGPVPDGTFYMADNSTSLAARMDALGEDVVAVLRLRSDTLPAEGARCGFSESRNVPRNFDTRQATSEDCSDVTDDFVEEELDFYLFPADYLPEDDGDGGDDPDGEDPDGGDGDGSDGGDGDGSDGDGGDGDGGDGDGSDGDGSDGGDGDGSDGDGSDGGDGDGSDGDGGDGDGSDGDGSDGGDGDGGDGDGSDGDGSDGGDGDGAQLGLLGLLAIPVGAAAAAVAVVGVVLYRRRRRVYLGPPTPPPAIPYVDPASITAGPLI